MRQLLSLSLAALLSSSVGASEPVPSGLYAITIETSMPHLEENLRYTTICEEQCLEHLDPPTVFPVLRHAALADCRLVEQGRTDEQITYLLTCDGGHGTTGNALWTREPQRLAGELHVKLGGKNMTFSQRWTAVRLRSC